MTLGLLIYLVCSVFCIIFIIPSIVAIDEVKHLMKVYTVRYTLKLDKDTSSYLGLKFDSVLLPGKHVMFWVAKNDHSLHSNPVGCLYSGYFNRGMGKLTPWYWLYYRPINNLLKKYV